jgi:hypothetical protein
MLARFTEDGGLSLKLTSESIEDRYSQITFQVLGIPVRTASLSKSSNPKPVYKRQTVPNDDALYANPSSLA